MSKKLKLTSSLNLKLMRDRLSHLINQHRIPGEQNMVMSTKLSNKLIDMVIGSNNLSTAVMNPETVIDALDRGHTDITFIGDSENKKAIANYLNVNYNEVTDMINNKINNDMNIVGNPPFNDVQGNARQEAANTNNSNIYERCINSAIKVCKTGQIAFVIPQSFMYAPSLESLKNNLINHGLKYLIELDCSVEFPNVSIRAGVCIILSEAGYNGDIEISRIDGSKFKIKRGARLHFSKTKYFDNIEKITTKYTFWDDSQSKGSYAVASGCKGNLDRVIEKSPITYSHKSSPELNTEVLIYSGREGKDNGKWLYSSDQYVEGKWGVAIPKQTVLKKLGRILLIAPNQGVSDRFRVVWFDTENEARNAKFFWEHDLFKFAIKVIKTDDKVNKENNSYIFLPMIDFKTKLTTQEIYQKYNINQNEIDDINTYIRTN